MCFKSFSFPPLLFLMVGKSPFLPWGTSARFYTFTEKGKAGKGF